jgi:perosamine synthetase
MTIQHNKPWVTDQDKRSVADVLESGWIADGVQTEKLLNELAKYLAPKDNWCLTDTGTAALFTALKALQLNEGALVAVPTYACRALLDAIILARLKPIIADVQNDLNIDPASLKEFAAQGKDVKAIVAVHTFGHMCKIEELKSFGATIIEDCCHSLGGRHQESHTGTKIFSFYATKIITGGQGGAVFTGDKEQADSIRAYLEKNIRPGKYLEGFNFRMTDIQAGLILSQVKRLDDIFRKRSAIAHSYYNALPPSLKALVLPFDADRMYYRFVLRFPGVQLRNEAFDFFASCGIGTSKLFRNEELLHNAYARDLDYYHADSISQSLLSLPIYPALSEDEIGRVVDALKRLA